MFTGIHDPRYAPHRLWRSLTLALPAMLALGVTFIDRTAAPGRNKDTE